MEKLTAESMVQQGATATMAVLKLDGVAPLRALYVPHYLRELRTEVVEVTNGNHLIAVIVPKRGYGTYKRRGPRNKSIPPEIDSKQLEAVFSLFLPHPFRCVAIRNALENVIIFLEVKNES